MYPHGATETELLKAILDDSIPDKGHIIKEYIDNHDTRHMAEGEDYYFKRNKITKRQIYRYDNNGNKLVDEEATNNKLASGWHKLLVDQKVGYLVGDPVTIGSKSDQDITLITDILGEEFDDVLPELVKGASNKGREWLHVFVDEKGDFDYILIAAQEIIPIYDNAKRKNLVGAIRYYELDDETVKIELWDDKTITFYEVIDGNVVMDMSEEINPASHFYYGDKGYGWDKVPFIEFPNNEERVNDLTFYKDLIDAYDNLMSDTTNTLEDIQELFYVLKGYEDTNLAEFSTNLKRYKGVKVDAEGGVDPLQAQVPTESINNHLDRLIEDIYAFGMAVNNSPDKFGNAPSGVALKNLYSLLDMKANVLERKFTKGLERLMWFVCEYLSISNQGNFDYKDLTYTYNKTMLMNDLETVDMAQKSLGVISKATIIKNHPWTTDLQGELDAIERESESTIVELDDDDEEEPTD